MCLSEDPPALETYPLSLHDALPILERLLNPSSVLLVGVSSRVDSAGGRFLTALERSGFEGGIHLVSREVFEIRGHAAHAHIRDEIGRASCRERESSAVGAVAGNKRKVQTADE